MNAPYYLLPEPWRSLGALGCFLSIIAVGVWYIWVPLLKGVWKERRRDPNCSGIVV